jgi:hypothetical protein
MVMMTLNYYRALYNYWTLNYYRTLNNHRCVVMVMTMVWSYHYRSVVVVMTMMWCNYYRSVMVMTHLYSVVMTIMMTLC